MTKSKTGLGRGLDALINPNFNKEKEEPITVSSKDIGIDDGNSYDILAKIDIKKIIPNPYQPRTEFTPDTLLELKNSILQNGLIQPITVRRGENSIYELISGERRLRVCREIGYKEIPAYIIRVETKEAMLALSLIENIQRETLNPIEIATAYKKLIDECNLSQEEVAYKVGKDRTTITNTIRLLKLPDEIKKLIIKGELSAGHARALINLPDTRFQLKLVRKIINDQLSVRKVEEIVKKYSEEDKLHRDIQTQKKTRIEVSNSDLENKLRELFGTKVLCKQKKDGSGTIQIEFYSNDELERLFELFDIIKKYNN